MSTTMSEKDWDVVVSVFRGCLPHRGDRGRNDRLFLEALHCFSVHNITWRAPPKRFGHWNSVWKRFSRLSRSGVFETFFAELAASCKTAHLVQMVDSTVIRAHVACIHVSAAGVKGGKRIRRSAGHPRSALWVVSAANPPENRSSGQAARLRAHRRRTQRRALVQAPCSSSAGSSRGPWSTTRGTTAKPTARPRKSAVFCP